MKALIVALLFASLGMSPVAALDDCLSLEAFDAQPFQAVLICEGGCDDEAAVCGKKTSPPNVLGITYTWCGCAAVPDQDGCCQLFTENNGGSRTVAAAGKCGEGECPGAIDSSCDYVAKYVTIDGVPKIGWDAICKTF